YRIMQELLDTLQTLKTNTIKEHVDARLAEFHEIKTEPIHSIFKELCFCIMTANCSAAKCIEVHEHIGNDFLTVSEIELANKFKELGYRFPHVRSKFIIEAREKMSQLEIVMKSANGGKDLREWIVKNIKGIGYKEASHFLRNIGYSEYAIVDFHIVDLLARHNIVEKPKSMTKTKYLEIEDTLKTIGKKVNLNMAELDLYLWYLETGKILK
ncbi:MAG: N-glycosylase/DNA lyase, partial [Candidatus Lokiarchaeota archaeon]|nr:N-glycosylase/DNA lyase [Candidatus Lokiarchaeota archaeon]